MTPAGPDGRGPTETFDQLGRQALTDDAAALPAIAGKSTIPVVADIHFQWKYAMAALEAGCAGVRINPGNIKKHDKVKLIAQEAAARGVPIRVGVNAGSLQKEILAKHGGPTAEALVSLASNPLVSTGLTFGTISALYGLNAGIIDRTQFSLLITVVVLSAIVPTAIAQRFFQPHPELGRAHRQPVEEFWPESEVA